MFYQGTRTAKAAVIGTIMPWSGPLSNIPDGWIICDGSTKNAKDYPLLVQAIGDTYNAGVSNLGGSFPNYLGEFLLPDLNDRMLMDIEESYFANVGLGGTGKPIDTDADARSIISPFIGDNTDNGSPVVFTNVYTDVVFTLNDRYGYLGSISGNTIIPGEGEKTVYIGGRKLGVTHVRAHGHSGSYETLANSDPERPGKGVVPYENIDMKFTYYATDTTGIIPDLFDQNGFQIDLKLRIYADNWSDVEDKNGFGNGIPGRTIARVHAEKPPINIRPKNVMRTPISNDLRTSRLQSEAIVPYGQNGGNLQIPAGFRNYYPDYPTVEPFGTLVSNTAGGDATGGWLQGDLIAHGHDPISVTYSQGSLKPQSRLTVSDAYVPSTTVLDNATNVGALQIDMNTLQPSLTCIYIIRAY